MKKFILFRLERLTMGISIFALLFVLPGMSGYSRVLGDSLRSRETGMLYKSPSFGDSAVSGCCNESLDQEERSANNALYSSLFNLLETSEYWLDENQSESDALYVQLSEMVQTSSYWNGDVEEDTDGQVAHMMKNWISDSKYWDLQPNECIEMPSTSNEFQQAFTLVDTKGTNEVQ